MLVQSKAVIARYTSTKKAQYNYSVMYILVIFSRLVRRLNKIINTMDSCYSSDGGEQIGWIIEVAGFQRPRIEFLHNSKIQKEKPTLWISINYLLIHTLQFLPGYEMLLWHLIVYPSVGTPQTGPYRPHPIH